jgi:hypothetical protein
MRTLCGESLFRLQTLRQPENFPEPEKTTKNP